METRQRPLCLLSLDGGGIRGLSELLVLKRIMFNLANKIGHTPDHLPKPCEYFDLIGGTSTGGLIAIMLGTLEMDVDTCIQRYLEMAPLIFPKEGFLPGNKLGKLFKGVVGSPRFPSEPLEKAIRELVGAELGPTKRNALLEAVKNHADGHSCKSFVCATNSDTSTCFRLRDYRSTWEPGTGCTIWEAARATAAAPYFFHPIRFGLPPQNWVDGGLRSNNPIRHVYDEARKIWPSRKICCFVSIGAGEKPAQAVGSRGHEILQTLTRIALDTRQTANEFRDAALQLPSQEQFELYRFNAGNIQSIALDEWSHFDSLTGLTNDYLNEQRQLVDSCAACVKSNSSCASSLKCFYLNSLPQAKSRFFGRDIELAQMENALRPREKGQECFVIYGLSGFGKTRLVLEFIDRRAGDYEYIVWIDASSYANALQSFHEAAISLYESGLIERLSSDSILKSPKATPNAVKRWLEKTSGAWLLVIDSFDTIDDFDAQEFLPQCYHGGILVTTSRRDLADSWATHVLDIPQLTDEASSQLLTYRLRFRDHVQHDPSNVSDLLELLSGVPLALEQASVLIGKGMSIIDFKKHYTTDYKSLMNRKPALSTWAYDKNRSVFKAFESLHKVLDEENADSSFLLSVFCFLGESGIPVRILSNQTGTTTKPDFGSIASALQGISSLTTQHLQRLCALLQDKLKLKYALDSLDDFCIVKTRRNMEAVPISLSIHNAIRQWCSARESFESAKALSLCACHLLCAYLQYLEHADISYALDLRLKTHFIACWSFFKEFWSETLTPLEPISKVATLFGKYFLIDYNYNLAIECLSLAVQWNTARESGEYSAEADSYKLIFALGKAYWLAGRWEQAEETLRRFLTFDHNEFDIYNDLCLEGAEILRNLRQRKMLTRTAPPSTPVSDLPKLIASSSQSPPNGRLLRRSSPANSDFDNDNTQYMDQEYSLNEILTQTAEEFGSNHVYTLEARIKLALFYEHHNKWDDSIDCIEEIPQHHFIDGLWQVEKHERTISLLTGAAGLYFRLLTEKGDTFFLSKDRFQYTLPFAFISNNIEICERLIKQGAPLDKEFYGFSLPFIHLASHFGGISTVRSLLDSGADPSATGIHGSTPLHSASLEGRIDVARLLLDRGADPSATDTYGSTPLHSASFKGHVDVARLLLERGANPSVTDTYGSTPLHSASLKGSVDVARLLLDRGVDLSIADNYGWTPLHKASCSGLIEVVELLLDGGADMSVANPKGLTPLKSALDNFHFETVKLLLDRGADLSTADLSIADKWIVKNHLDQLNYTDYKYVQSSNRERGF